MTDIFALDTNGSRALDEEARANPLRLEDLPTPAFKGAGDALKGLLRPSADAGRALATAGAVVPITQDFVFGLATGKDTTAAQDFYFRNVVDDTANSAIDYWTPGPGEMGSASKVLNVGASVVGTLPQIIGTPELFLGQSALSPATEVVRQGGGADTAAIVGGVNLAANAIGMKLPASWGTTLATRLGTGAGSNLVLGAVADAASAAALQADGMDDMAAGYDWTDPTARTLDLLMGAAFGYKAQVDVPKVMDGAQRDAVLTARNNDHMRRQTLPGDPISPRAQTAHAATLSTAVEQMLRGEPVNVADSINPADFILRPELQSVTAPGFDSAVRRVLRAEGGFVDNPADRGGATNFGISSRAHPGVDVRNLTREQATEIYRREYWDAIGADALPPGMQAVAFDAAVNQGAGWTRKALAKAGGDVEAFIRLREQRYRDIVAKDPTQRQFLNGWLNRLDEYRDGTPGLTFPEAGQIIDTRLAALDDAAGGRLQDADVAALRTEDADLIATMREHEQRQASGVLSADPATRLSADDVAFIDRRRAEIRQSLEQHRAAVEYGRQADNLRGRLDRVDRDSDLTQLAAELRGEAPAVRAPKPAKAAEQTAQAEEPATAAEQVSAERQPETHLDAALRLATDAPDTPVFVGADLEGNAVYRTAAEEMADIHAEQRRAETEASAFTVAANCAIRNGVV